MRKLLRLGRSLPASGYSSFTDFLRRQKAGVSAVEFALVSPVPLLILAGTVSGLSGFSSVHVRHRAAGLPHIVGEWPEPQRQRMLSEPGCLTSASGIRALPHLAGKHRGFDQRCDLVGHRL